MVVENDKQANQPDTVVVDKQRQSFVLIDVAI